MDEILSILKGTAPQKVKKVAEATPATDEVITVISDIKKPAKKVAEPKKEVAKKAVKKVAAKKPAAKKVTKKK
jgi:hypothetical protein